MPGKPLDKGQVRIGVIHVSNPNQETSGYAYAHQQGIRRMQRELGLRDDQIILKINISDTNQAETELAIRECIADGANVIIATSWWHMDVCEKLAPEYPGVIFANATGTKHNDTNFTNYFGRMYQARYLSGIVAGLRTRARKIGYVAAMGKENSEVSGGLNAFALGVESVNPKARIYVRVLHRWLDPTGESQAARLLIEEGCDVIAQHCNTPNPQIEAQKAGVWGIGFNSDMEADAPEAVIVSAVWNWGVYYTHLVRSVMDGSFTTTPYEGSIDDGMVELTPFNEALLPAGAAEAVASARIRITSGNFGVFDGEMRTNDGKIVGKPGTTLPDSEIIGDMNWYYHNIIEP
ncbi:MAG: BMP family ABC transporter substrate-binding protein [Deltaproteobacteria bacterium]|nr:BMP family ABC transporter substrate-binding protein [Deltaproteobacteria bacterium]